MLIALDRLDPRPPRQIDIDRARLLEHFEHRAHQVGVLGQVRHRRRLGLEAECEIVGRRLGPVNDLIGVEDDPRV